ncbi:MAG: hypothetical protein CL878_01760 [Dehalococcoidia bacterium]|nr:hypothetical protein [Dehalococcoidia bacterium]
MAPARDGLFGDTPTMARLDDGNLRYTTDFRSVYASIIEGWFGADSQAVLGAGYQKLDFLR